MPSYIAVVPYKGIAAGQPVPGIEGLELQRALRHAWVVPDPDDETWATDEETAELYVAGDDVEPTGHLAWIERDAGGTPVALWTRPTIEDDWRGTPLVDYLAPAGVLRETFPRSATGVSDQGSLNASGILQVTAIQLLRGDVVNSLTAHAGTTSATAPTHQWMCLLDADRNVLVKTLDRTNEAWAGGAAKTFIPAAPYEVVDSGLYYVGLLQVATVVATLRGVGGIASINAQAPIIAGRSTSGLTTPESLGAVAAALTSSGGRFYATVQ